MEKVLWLLPVTFIVGLRFLFPAMAAASSPIRDGGSSLGLSFAPEGGAGIDVIWIAMGSVVGLILILVVVTFIVLPKIKGGQAAKLGAKQAGNSRAIQGKGAPTPQSNSMPMARDSKNKQCPPQVIYRDVECRSRGCRHSRGQCSRRRCKVNRLEDFRSHSQYSRGQCSHRRCKVNRLEDFRSHSRHSRDQCSLCLREFQCLRNLCRYNTISQ
jgi:hypothetical protein